MEPTYTGGKLYAELDTGTTSGSDAVDWFILRPTLSGTHLSATVAAQGTVAVKNASLLYPYTTVNSHRVGYLLFSLSGPRNFPDPAYIRYKAGGRLLPGIRRPVQRRLPLGRLLDGRHDGRAGLYGRRNDPAGFPRHADQLGHLHLERSPAVIADPGLASGG